jgi:hypothetical protein
MSGSKGNAVSHVAYSIVRRLPSGDFLVCFVVPPRNDGLG